MGSAKEAAGGEARCCHCPMAEEAVIQKEDTSGTSHDIINDEATQSPIPWGHPSRDISFWDQQVGDDRHTQGIPLTSRCNAGARREHVMRPKDQQQKHEFKTVTVAGMELGDA